jgi:hypothetical protein
MNDHPLFSNLTELAPDELDKRYNELSRRWQQARIAGMDQYVLHQLDVMLSCIEEEKYRRAQLPSEADPVVIDTDPIEPKGKKA